MLTAVNLVGKKCFIYIYIHTHNYIFFCSSYSLWRQKSIWIDFKKSTLQGLLRTLSTQKPSGAQAEQILYLAVMASWGALTQPTEPHPGFITSGNTSSFITLNLACPVLVHHLPTCHICTCLYTHAYTHVYTHTLHYTCFCLLSSLLSVFDFQPSSDSVHLMSSTNLKSFCPSSLSGHLLQMHQNTNPKRSPLLALLYPRGAHLSLTLIASAPGSSLG